METENKMCSPANYQNLEERVDRLDARMDGIETRLNAVDVSVSTMHGEMSTGFADLHKQLYDIFAEKAKWSEWARVHLGRAIKWAGFIILAACGITQADKLAAIFK